MSLYTKDGNNTIWFINDRRIKGRRNYRCSCGKIFGKSIVGSRCSSCGTRVRYHKSATPNETADFISA